MVLDALNTRSPVLLMQAVFLCSYAICQPMLKAVA